MIFELRLRAVVYKDARYRGERLCAELIRVDAAETARNSGQVAYFNTVASFLSRLDRAGLQDNQRASVGIALEAVFRAPGIVVRVTDIVLDRAQLFALGFRKLALKWGANTNSLRFL
jgi:hypothetical protein